MSYVKNKELYEEIKISLKKDELTPEALRMLMLIAERANYKLSYRNSMDREDCVSFAVLDMVRYWRSFNPEKYKNAFAYYTQMAKNGYAKGWAKLYPDKYKGTMYLSGSTSDSSDEIYSI